MRISTPAKLNSLGMDTMALASALQKIGRSNKHITTDIVHGNPLDRALNVSLAHRVIDFPSILESQQSSQPIPPEWKQQVQESISNRLWKLPANEEYKKLLEQAGPTVFLDHMRSLFPQSLLRTVDIDGVKEIPKQLAENQKFNIVLDLVRSRIEKSNLTSDEKRRAYYLCLSENISDSFLRDHFKFSRYQGSLYQIKPNDFSEEGLRSLISLHQNQKAYEVAGLKSVKTLFPRQFVGEGDLFKQAMISPQKISAEMYRNIMGGDLSAEKIVDLLTNCSKVVEGTAGPDNANIWLRTHINILIHKLIKDNKGQSTLPSQVLDVLRYSTKQHNIIFSIGQLRNMTSQVFGVEGWELEKSQKAKNLFGEFLKELHSPDPRFENAIRSQNFEEAIQMYIQNPSDLKQQLAYLITQPGKISPDARDAIMLILAKKMGDLHSFGQPQLLSETEKAFKEKSLPFDLSNIENKTLEQFGQASDCLDILYILQAVLIKMNE